MVFHTNEESIKTNNFLVCKNDKLLYFFLNDKVEADKLFNQLVVNKIILKFKDEKYEALPLKVFNSNLPESKLHFTVEQESLKLDYYQGTEGKWFCLAQNDFKSSLLKPMLDKCDSCSWEKRNSN